MNNTRRNKIKRIIKKAELWYNAEDLLFDIDDILLEEEDAYNSMPENLQYSMRGMDSQDAIDNLNDAVEFAENGQISKAIESLKLIL